MSLAGRKNVSNPTLRKRSVSADRGHPRLENRSRPSSGVNIGRSSSEERKSVTNFQSSIASGRKSSFALPKPNELISKESRRLTDKAYQKEKLTELIEFLQTSGFQHQYTVGNLVQMCKKDFEAIFEHLVNYIFPEYTVKQIEEEAPKILKQCGYPFIPKKYSFVHVSQTNRPQLFGILLFLLDTVKYVVELGQVKVFDTDDDEDAQNKEMNYLLEYIHYQFKNKSEENDDTDIKVFSSIITDRYPDSKKLETECENCEKELKEAHAKLESANKLKNDCEIASVDIANSKNYLERMKVHCEKKQRLTQKLKAEIQEKENELKKQEAKLAALQVKYDAQGFDGKKQREFFEEQKTQLQQKLESKKEEVRLAINELWGLQIQLTKIQDKLTLTAEQLVEEFSKVRSTFENIFNSLNLLDDRTCLHQIQMHLPELPQTVPQVLLFAEKNPRWLDKIKDQIQMSISLLKATNQDLSLKLHALKMKKSKVSINLKSISSEKNQKRNNMDSEEKRALEEMQSLEKEYDDALAQLEKVEVDFKKDVEIVEELEETEKLRQKLQKDIDEYKADAEILFARHKTDIETLAKLIQESGNEINEATRKYFNL